MHGDAIGSNFETNKMRRTFTTGQMQMQTRCLSKFISRPSVSCRAVTTLHTRNRVCVHSRKHSRSAHTHTAENNEVVEKMHAVLRENRNKVTPWSGTSDKYIDDEPEDPSREFGDDVKAIDFVPETQAEIDSLLEKYGVKALRVELQNSPSGNFRVVSPEKPFVKKEYKRVKEYPLKKRYLVGNYANMFSDCDILLVYQHNGGKEAAEKYAEDLCRMEGFTVLKTLKNSLASVAMAQSKDENLRKLAALMNGPISIIMVKCEDEHLVHNLNKILDGQDKKKSICFYGAKVQDSVLDHEDIEMLSKIGSTISLRSQLIQTIASPAHNLIRALSTPQNNLVKTLDFKVKQSGEEE